MYPHVLWQDLQFAAAPATGLHSAPADLTIYKDILEVPLTPSTHIKIICGAAEGQAWDGASVNFLSYLVFCCVLLSLQKRLMISPELDIFWIVI